MNSAALLVLAIYLFCFAVWFAESGRKARIFRELWQRFSALPLSGKLLTIVLLAGFILYGGTKPEGRSSGVPDAGDAALEDDGMTAMEGEGSPLASLSANQYLAGFALVRVATNTPPGFSTPSNAVIYAPWGRCGVAEDTFWLPATNWCFTLGTNAVDGLHVSSSGAITFGRPKGSPLAREMPDALGIAFLAPLQGSIGIAPPQGRFWHAPTPSNSLLLTWQDVYFNRDTNYPISFQSELFANGDFTFRYDLSRFPTPDPRLPTTHFVIGAQHNGGGETYAFGDTNRLVNGLELHWRAFGYLDPAIADHDGDELSTYDELMIHGSDPRMADSDGDGIEDGDEVAAQSDALDPDEDGDGIPDGIDLTGYDTDDPDLVFRLGNDIAPSVILTLDTDADGWADWVERRFGTDPGAAWDTPEGLDTLFRATVALAASPAERGVLSVDGRRVLVAGASTWQFWLPGGVEHAVTFRSPHHAAPPFTFAFNRPTGVRIGMLVPDGAGGDFGKIMLPLLAVQPGHPRCCHYDREPCETYTAYIMPPMAGAYTWLVDDIPGYGVGNRLDVGHDIESICARFTPANGLACLEKSVQPNAHCSGFYENLHSGVKAANLIYANTDDDDGDEEIDNNDFYVANEDDLAAVTPLTVPNCCPCEVHAATNWSCHIETKTDNLRAYESSEKLFEFAVGRKIDDQQTIYVEGRASSTNRFADWIDWAYEGLANGPDGEPVATNFTVRSFYTVIDLQATPVRLEPITTATNSQGVIRNPAGVAGGALALYRVEVVPEGIIPDEAIHWSKSNGNVAFYAGQDIGREAVIRGVTPGNFTLEVAIDDLPATYRPYIHGWVMELTVTPIHVYIICDSNGVPAVSTATVNAWVAEANRIYRQAAMSFAVVGVEHVTNQAWTVIESAAKFDQVASCANVTSGIELYCVPSITFAAGLHSDPRLTPDDPRCGMAVQSGAQGGTMAHESGHACGLMVIRYVLPNATCEDLAGSPNWSGGDGTGYHIPGLAHAEVAQRLMMYYMENATHADVPVGSVMGTDNSQPDPYPVGVGLDAMTTRAPLH